MDTLWIASKLSRINAQTGDKWVRILNIGTDKATECKHFIGNQVEIAFLAELDAFLQDGPRVCSTKGIVWV
jgi:hypothetical protein